MHIDWSSQLVQQVLSALTGYTVKCAKDPSLKPQTYDNLYSTS